MLPGPDLRPPSSAWTRLQHTPHWYVYWEAVSTEVTRTSPPVPYCAPVGHAEANMLIASRSTFNVAFVPSADRIGHSADTHQRRLSAAHRCPCLSDHRKLRTGRTHQRKDCRRLRSWGNPAA